MYVKTLTVSELSTYIKKIIDTDFILSNTNVKGEISNFKIHSSGHVYFSLKDDFGKINCIMFKNKFENIKFLPENGMSVVIKGKVSVYQKDGSYQLYCNDIELEGAGKLSAAFENLKKKLEAKGLFDVSAKKVIPKHSRRIGVVTSPTGAAIRDIINVSKRRNNKVNILIYPALVQGPNAPNDIIKGIEYLNTVKDVDVILIARGGGSIEELWSFNDEALAKAIFKSKKPIVTAVGHETDFTMVDYVSDLRAPTPSAGAELLTLDLNEVNFKIDSYRENLKKLVKNNINNEKSKLFNYKKSLEYNSPVVLITNAYKQLDNLNDTLNVSVRNRLKLEEQKLSKINALLNAHNPLNVLNRGYAIIKDEDNNLITHIGELSTKNNINITLKDGNANFNIINTEKITSK
ncbi:Exodeoxyribonuclease VII large subunit [Clostridium acidisoli DSM 12555]|uniref:Exodeoxyribonuclease 7 large subunit n=1 Tax=Clostridium acidisoli DSM 12555 TaxID=1121291 RepID=A0A1W1X0R1_9CLOT|nr:exodeoxyribonuclease VII large subunit [Clostridium acidisoli]SMC17542.1 Exodeoxyribonuclease VII large subunit [Clostridium acidisoli DSM 12555]